jgi:uncharacterized RDD family membrane protein YckC
MKPTLPSVFEELNRDKSLQFATYEQRFFNALIDIIVYYVICRVLSHVLGMCFVLFNMNDVLQLMYDDSKAGVWFRFALSCSFFFIIYTCIEAVFKGMTLGKLITKTRAVKEDGNFISLKQAALRSLSRMVPFEFLSVLTGNLWHDKWSKTYVIKKTIKM